MRDSSSTVIGILTAALMIFSLFLPSFLVSPVSAQEGGAVFIVSGKATAYNINTQGVGPEDYYTSSPPIIMAQKVGSGAVVAGGIIAGCRNGSWNNPANPDNYFDKLFDAIFKWMRPGLLENRDNVLWYEGYAVYNTSSACSQLIAALKDLGYSVTGNNTQPITSSFLAPYDILIIPQLQLGDVALLPDNDVQTIKSFVEGGGGLLIMEQSDFQGHQFPTIQNKILRKLGFTYGFQDDQVEDNVNHWGGADPEAAHPDENYFRVIVDVDVTTEIGAAYQAATGKTEIGLYSVCSLGVLRPLPPVDVATSAGGKIGDPGDTLTFEVTVKNTGDKPDTYTVTAEDTLGWSLSKPETGFSLGVDESKQVEVEVTIPPNLVEKACDEILVKAVGVSGGEDNTILRASAYVPRENTLYPIRQLIPGEEYYWFSTCTLQVEPPAVPIMCCTKTGEGMELTAREPWPMLYKVGEYPPMGAAEFVGKGRVIAQSGLGAFRSLPVNQWDDPRLAGKKLAPLMVQWLIDWETPADHKFLFYCSQGAFHNAERLYEWLDMVENELGFGLGIQEGGTITPELLADYDVLFISGLELPLLPSERQAIADWVRNGGGLLLMEQSDYESESHPLNTNAVLETLGYHMRFNDDEVYDNVRWTKDGPWFPQCYLLDVREVNPEFDMWFPAYAFTAGMPVESLTANDVRVLFSFTITNAGTRDSSYEIEVQETSSTLLGWDIEWWPTEVSIASGENIEGYITVTVPKIEAVMKRMTLCLTVTDKTQTYLTRSVSFAILGENRPVATAKFENGQSVSHARLGNVTIMNLGYSGGGAWTYVVETTGGEVKIVPEAELSGGEGPEGQGFPLWIIAAAIVVIVVVVVAVYFVMLKKK